MSDLFVVGFETGWETTGEGHNGECCKPRRPWAEFWADKIADARVEAWAAILASNLATAAALCHAFRLGHWWCCSYERLDDDAWHPGCQREAP